MPLRTLDVLKQKLYDIVDGERSLFKFDKFVPVFKSMSATIPRYYYLSGTNDDTNVTEGKLNTQSNQIVVGANYVVSNDYDNGLTGGETLPQGKFTFSFSPVAGSPWILTDVHDTALRDVVSVIVYASINESGDDDWYNLGEQTISETNKSYDGNDGLNFTFTWYMDFFGNSSGNTVLAQRYMSMLAGDESISNNDDIRPYKLKFWSDGVNNGLVGEDNITWAEWEGDFRDPTTVINNYSDVPKGNLKVSILFDSTVQMGPPSIANIYTFDNTLIDEVSISWLPSQLEQWRDAEDANADNQLVFTYKAKTR